VVQQGHEISGVDPPQSDQKSTRALSNAAQTLEETVPLRRFCSSPTSSANAKERE
jgi:hypothetical protein